MARFSFVCLLAVLGALPAALWVPCAQGQDPQSAMAPSYQRQRGGDWSGQASGYYPPGGPRPSQQPEVAAGTYQRPYPYHLDYYKQRYNGSYDPYFGNLYGPPNVVLGAPYAYGYPAYGAAAEWPAEAQPGAAGSQAILCPHCHQPIYFTAPAAPAEQ